MNIRRGDAQSAAPAAGVGTLTELLRRLDVPAPVHAGQIPSPLERHDLLTRELGVELWIKREDLIDDRGAGHKARKLAYVAADAAAAGASLLMTAVSLPSSQAVAVAAAASRYGMRAHVVYCGDEQRRPSTLRGNYLLVALLGATVTWREQSAWTRWPEYLRAVARAERAKGERPYLVPPGISRWPGLLGSVELGIELAGQVGPGAPFHLVGAAGSGGSLLGVSIGLRAAGVQARAHGVCIGAPAAQVGHQVAALRKHAALHLCPALVAEAELKLYDDARGGGYGAVGDTELHALKSAAARYGLLLDPIYMAKTFIGLRRLVESGCIPEGARVVLVHSGGTVGLLGGGDSLDDWIRRHSPGLLV